MRHCQAWRFSAESLRRSRQTNRVRMAYSVTCAPLRTAKTISLILASGMPDAKINDIVFAVRKGAHVTEYAILTLLVWRLRRKLSAENLQAWQWRMAGETLWFAALYAATDEFHQTFVP